MKKSTIITIVAFVLGIVVLATAFILLTDNNISKKIFAPKETPSVPDIAPSTPNAPKYQRMDFFEEDVSKFITLAPYKGLNFEVPQLEATNEEIELEIGIDLCQSREFTPRREGVISEKMFFSFNYTGYYVKEDGTKGEKFYGGAGTDQLAYIEGNSLVTISASGIGGFIDGFAQGILNKNVGETFDLAITFPDPYFNNYSMSGMKTIFEVTINYIAETHFTDAWVKQYTKEESKTCDEYRQVVKKEVEAVLKAQSVNLLVQSLIENSEIINLPQQEFDYWYDYYQTSIKQQAESLKITYEELLVKLGFEDDAALRNYIIDTEIKSELFIIGFAQAEIDKATDEEYKLLLESLILQTGKTEAEILEIYSERYIRQVIVYEKFDKLLEEYNTFVVKPTEE